MKKIIVKKFTNRVLAKFDRKMMQRAIELASRARISAPPNPWVGCVIEKNGVIVGEGYTSPPGKAHAEINAINQAGANAAGGTAYITLEPCCHYGKTPPCSQALIFSNIRRVVVGVIDPDSRVSGRGVEELLKLGLEVECGVCEEMISAQLAPYLHHRRTGLPYCVAKAAVSVDGRIAAADGTSKWLTGQEARLDAHQLRAESQAILIGGGTAAKDLPSLTVRNVSEYPLKSPLRVVLDARGIVLPPSPLLNVDEAPTLIITSRLCPQHIIEMWENCGVETAVVENAADYSGVNLLDVLQLLGKKGILQLLIEGGGGVLGSFLKESHIQQLVMYIAPCILGNSGIPLFQNQAITTLSEAPKLQLQQAKCLGSSVRLDYIHNNF